MPQTSLTQEEIQRANEYIATLGPDKIAEKKEILAKLKEGDEVFAPFIRALINN